MPPCSDVPSWEGSWQLIGFRKVSTGNLEGDPGVEGKSVVFTFSDNRKEGTIKGHTFVNTISGTYQFDGDCRYTIKEFGGTKVGEPGWSSKAWLTVSTGNYERIKDQLIIYRNKGAEAMIFKKVN